MDEETITIICDDEDCRAKYVLSMETLRTVRSVKLICKNCGNIQVIRLNQNTDMEICYVK